MRYAELLVILAKHYPHRLTIRIDRTNKQECFQKRMLLESLNEKFGIITDISCMTIDRISNSSWLRRSMKNKAIDLGKEDIFEFWFKNIDHYMEAALILL
jgi:hypothetical protein